MGFHAPHPADPVVGALVDGRYRVIGLIAQGGMATVYRAEDTRLDRLVALKVMHRSFAEDPGFVARFEHEARAAAKLSDPHVVGVFDQGAHDGLVWLAMDFVPGYTLREVIRVHAPLEPDRALGVVEQILSGLVAAHSAGFVHRDIKPENVLMTPEGNMKITDFGLAKALLDDAAPAATKGVLMGTVAYLAPEQVESGYADERSDIYATGIVLYELLTGRVPFAGSTPMAVAYRHVNERVPPPSASVDGIPTEVDQLVRRATARNPAERFPSAQAFLEAAQSVWLDDGEIATSAADAAGAAADSQPTTLLPSGTETRANTAPTTALQPGANTAPTTALPGTAIPRGGPGTLTPVTRRPPYRDSEGTVPQAEDVRSISRFGRTKLVVFLLMLVTLMSTVGWWLGMQHNTESSQPAAPMGSQSAAAAPASTLSGSAFQTYQA